MNVYIIYGSPLSGKSTYVEKNKGPNDLIYDFDLVMSSISGKEIHIKNDNLINYVTDIRDLIITKLKSEKNIDNVFIITTRVTEDLKENLVGLNPIYKEMKIDIATAKKRLKDNPGNRNIDLWTKVIDKYFISMKDYSNFHKSMEWERKRIVTLKRDSYECQQSKRYGKVEEANTVHHIIPVEERPDLRLSDKNLISLTDEQHKMMHKPDGTLSKLGKELRDRTIRKYPELLSPL